MITPIQSPLPIKDPADLLPECHGEEVSLWHFPMMNDSVRNAGYDQALTAAIQNKKGAVLDIGTGAGLLAMMAARQGAQVVTCETVPVIASKAKQIIQQNGYQDQITLVQKLSTKLEVGRDVPEKFDILVTEIFDDGLLGEEAFTAIKHAKKYLLNIGAQIIPAQVRVLAIALESEEIYQNFRVSESAGFNVKAFNEFSISDYVGIHLDKMAYRALCKPTPIFSFDFNDLPSGHETRIVPMEITATGRVHAIAFWFELQLDANTMISSSPGLPQLSSWKQAVQMAESPDLYEKGTMLSVVAHHDESAIWFTRPKP